jgi:hypothetical protein
MKQPLGGRSLLFRPRFCGSGGPCFAARRRRISTPCPTVDGQTSISQMIASNVSRSRSTASLEGVSPMMSLACVTSPLRCCFPPSLSLRQCRHRPCGDRADRQWRFEARRDGAARELLRQRCTQPAHWIGMCLSLRRPESSGDNTSTGTLAQTISIPSNTTSATLSSG